HEAFARRRVRAHVALVGAGALGRRLLALLAARADAYREAGVALHLAAVADSRRLALHPEGFRPEHALDVLAGAPAADTEALVRTLAGARLERLVVVDATASEALAARHADLLRAGVAVVTPNKAVTARDADGWAEAARAARTGEAPYLYEAAVGAGLGVVARLRDLIRTGDRVHRVEGVLSGTLAFVFDAMRRGEPFSAAVRAAQATGLTEPDPREDLSGRDVARKLALLAYEMGLAADPRTADVASLVPPDLAALPLEAFWERLGETDAAWAERCARAEGALHYVARLDADGRIRAGVEAVAPGAPFDGLRGASVAVAFHTARYGAEPFVIRGPGATADVTAAVLLADIARAAEAMR
ncbi:MAG: bifunctional aspartate kinase/homoserine dehydrogenase I, partial [Rubricoccaceae bacterium]